MRTRLRSRRSATFTVIGALTTFAAAACSSGSSGSSAHEQLVRPSGAAAVSAAAPGPAGAWPTYHRSNDRVGSVSQPGRTPARLSRAWRARLDGAVYGQPLVIGTATVVATENNSVYALDVATGHRLWHRHLGTAVHQKDLPCGNIDPLGITGTPAYDAATGAVFVATETAGSHHDLVSLDVGTGAVRFARDLDVTTRDRHAEQQRGALAVANGRVYVPFGGRAGDCGNYVGYVAAVPTSGHGRTTRYEVPTSREGGIWAASGPAVAADGDIFVAVGNGASTGGAYDGSDSVLRLSGDLARRIAYFAPSTWGAENAADADLGSTGPLLLPHGLAMVSGKTGDVYLLDAERLGGVGGQLASVGGCRGFGGLAYAAAAAYIPCAEGLLRVNLHGRTMTRGWQSAPDITGSPVVSGETVWSLDTASGTLHALAASNGRRLASTPVGAVTRFASPTLAGSRVLVPTKAGVTAVLAR